MKQHLLRFINILRAAQLPITLAETLDCMRAAEVSGMERPRLQEALAATLVKDEADRPAFDAAFDQFFGAPTLQRGKRRSSPTAAGDGGGIGDDGIGTGRRPRADEPKPRSSAPIPSPDSRELRQRQKEPARGAYKLARLRALHDTPFHELSADDIEECDVLVAVLAERWRAYCNRRQRAAHRGRLDIRRTLRRSISTGGVPIDPAFRRRRPGRPDLIVLCDHSYSVATASRFLFALIAPAHEFFRRVRLLAFVDTPVEVSIESGTVVPHTALDLHARSDFGNVLVTFWDRYASTLTRNTLVLILGDARNNRRPPRADLLDRMRRAVKGIIWLNPEAPQRWNTGDSAMQRYAPHCDIVLVASNLRQLYRALQAASGSASR